MRPPPPPPDGLQPVLPLPPGWVWQVILADPPWSFDDKGCRLAPDSTRIEDQPARGYQTMPTAEIARMAPSVDDNAVLYLWSTWTHVLDGSPTLVARSWGFEPKTIIPWLKVSTTERPTRASFADHPALRRLYQASLPPLPGREHRRPLKLRIGGGHYTRGVMEPLVVAVRGSMVVPSSDRLPGVIVALRGSHSEKPPEVYDMIETLHPAARYPRRLELFTRSKPHPGWATYGDQAHGGVPLRSDP